MSLKPPKKSDLGKSWMKPRRDKNILICPEYHLIVTEGTETEPQYFEAIRTIINSQYRDKIQLDIHGAGDNTLSLLDKAMNLVMNNPNGYKHVWIVYDTDDFRQNASIKQMNYALICLQRKHNIMLSGQISVLNFGFCFISVLFSQIFIEVITGQNYLNG